MNAIVAYFRLTHYSTMFREHTMLKLEFVAWKQKTCKKKAKWNELKGELNNLLDATPLFIIIN